MQHGAEYHAKKQSERFSGFKLVMFIRSNDVDENNDHGDQVAVERDLKNVMAWPEQAHEHAHDGQQEECQNGIYDSA